ncbi:unnamed protein product [Allacma fusca]|uniref:Uncharacterized protein n=1 Tax=Allacma fusca TaxID=39272 RepID=A0A8J2K7Z3_9HEXA|nr:unnamed protein product [Allacma fusca]
MDPQTGTATLPPNLFHKVFYPNELKIPISGEIGKILYNCSKNACTARVIPFELNLWTKKIKVCSSNRQLLKFWLNCFWIMAEASYVLFRFAFVTYYKTPVTNFEYLYTSALMVVYCAGVFTMLLTYLRRYELQDLINTVVHFNEHGGPRTHVETKFTPVYFLLRFLPLGVYSLAGCSSLLFLACKTSPSSFYSVMDPSYRDSWLIVIPHCVHEFLVPAIIVTSFLFPVLNVLGFMELVKLAFSDYLYALDF